MLHIAICVKDFIQARQIENKLSFELAEGTYCINLIDTCTHLIQEYKKGRQYEVVFLEVIYEDITETEVVKHLREYCRRCKIVLISNNANNAVIGYSIGVIDFLLKPFNQKRFSDCLERVLSSNILKSLTTSSTNELYHKEKGNTYIIKSRGGLALLKESEILYVESFLKKVDIHCENQNYVSNEGISYVADKLSNNFIRISRFHVVNLNFIVAIDKGEVILATNERIKCSKNKYKHVKCSFIEFKKNEKSSC